MFAGKEISRALGKMAISAEECNDKLDDLTERELGILADWEAKFIDKYTVVGKVSGKGREREEQKEEMLVSLSFKDFGRQKYGEVHRASTGTCSKERRPLCLGASAKEARQDMVKSGLEPSAEWPGILPCRLYPL